ncbi:unnamed protein product [Pieris macdunnoughi]|uniref:Uncharacterized protein n=1 Tax=Pieris macdunnoughi TaxID=345717 RepID=A0A821VQ59_9NEOP|nr:unnamed protein product [Pieris macdunnoughi]
MEDLIRLTSCDDGRCCCLTPRTSVVLISIIGQVGCLLEIVSNYGSECITSPRHVDTLRNLLLTFFQMANMLLLLGSIVEYAWLLRVYLWYTLAFIVLGFVVSIAGFLYRYQHHGVWSLAFLVPEVTFLFVMYRCLPLVDTYRRRIEVIGN